MEREQPTAIAVGASMTTPPRCPMLTVYGGEQCRARAKFDLPVCSNHVPHWVSRDAVALLTVIRQRAMRVGGVWPYGHSGTGKGSIAGLSETRPGREIIVHVAKRPGAPMPPQDTYLRSERKGMMGLRLDLESALVVADLLESLGNGPAAMRIRQAIAAPCTIHRDESSAPDSLARGLGCSVGDLLG